MSEKSFVDIALEMLESGCSKEEVLQNLKTVGLNAIDSQKLVDVLFEKAVSKFGERLSALVEKKIISLKDARKIEQKRWIKSRKKRLQDDIWQARESVQKVLRDIAPGQIGVFNAGLNEFERSLGELERSKREMRAFLAELEKKKLKGSQRRIIKSAKELFKP